MITADFELDKRFKKHLQAHFERFTAQAGVLQDSAYFDPRPKSAGYGTLGAGLVRRKSPRTNKTVGQVAEYIRTIHRVPYLTAPFEKNSTERKKLGAEIARLVTGKASGYGAIEAALRALIRVPIITGRYGTNAPSTAKRKGFNRFLVDTGQFYRAITAKVRRYAPK